MLNVNDLEWVYSVVNTNGIFIGLNQRAINFLIENGDWLRTQDAEDYGYKGDFGMLFVSSDSKQNNFCNLIGCLYGDNIIPTFVHDWYPYVKEEELENVKFMPLYRYKMDRQKVSDTWLYEVVDHKKSDLYKDIRLMCLVDSDNNRLFEWSDDELEIAELMMEYHLGL